MSPPEPLTHSTSTSSPRRSGSTVLTEVLPPPCSTSLGRGRAGAWYRRAAPDRGRRPAGVAIDHRLRVALDPAAFHRSAPQPVRAGSPLFGDHQPPTRALVAHQPLRRHQPASPGCSASALAGRARGGGGRCGMVGVGGLDRRLRPRRRTGAGSRTVERRRGGSRGPRGRAAGSGGGVLGFAP